MGVELIRGWFGVVLLVRDWPQMNVFAIGEKLT